MAQGIQAGSSVAVTDGSFLEGSPIGTSGFVLCPTIDHIQTDTGVLIGANQVPGALEDQSAYRSELAGIEGILVTLDLLCTTYSITSGKVEIGHDGESALKEAEQEHKVEISGKVVTQEAPVGSTSTGPDRPAPQQELCADGIQNPHRLK
jgi:hypothetical protein